ncbi:hypothetical protein [Marinilabilia salmonicolor]|uniref:Uncharacterized protein n=1 Tax=Marinilabilia salmonicolor TaxID=989 RepID=A0A368V6M9_9BACT|nr:hypothetical protein [Marinilabilia salmonicolor]RCW36776.1 hypothetical protein DFO77_10767 [Marinilabilia salmonicolor]
MQDPKLPDEVFIFSLPGFGKGLYIGEMAPRNAAAPEAPFFGKTFINYKDTFTFTTGRNKKEIEKKSRALVAYTTEYLWEDALEARMFRYLENDLISFN